MATKKTAVKRVLNEVNANGFEATLSGLNLNTSFMLPSEEATKFLKQDATGCRNIRSEVRIGNYTVSLSVKDHTHEVSNSEAIKAERASVAETKKILTNLRLRESGRLEGLKEAAKK